MSLYIIISWFHTEPLTKSYPEKRGMKGWDTACHITWPSSHQWHCSCTSSSPSSVIFPCCPTLAPRWQPSVPAGLTQGTSGQPFISGLPMNGSPASPKPHGAPHVQILPHSCGKGPEQPLQDPVGSCHAGHSARADLSHHPHGSISLSSTPCKSSLSLIMQGTTRIFVQTQSWKKTQAKPQNSNYI